MKRIWERHDAMQVIGHGEKQTPVPISAFLTEGNGLDQSRPDRIVRQLIGATRQAVDRNEEGLLCGIDPIRRIVRKLFAMGIHGR